MKKIISSVLIVTLIFCLLPKFSVSAACELPLPNYPNGEYWDRGQCWAFAQMVYSQYWGVEFSSSPYTDDNLIKNIPMDETSRKCTVENIKKYISQAPKGSCLRISPTLYNASIESDDDSGHSFIIVDHDDNTITHYSAGGSSVIFTTESYEKFVYERYLGTQPIPEYAIGNFYIKYLKVGCLHTDLISETTVMPMCESEGLITHTCVNCSFKKTEIIPATGHSYTNNCDNSCNNCGFIRTIEHTYSYNCDCTCDICGYRREVSSHLYDDKNDPSCNICGCIRTITECTEGYYTYTIKDCVATIISVDSSISGDITVPLTIDGYPVTKIDSEAFEFCNKLMSINLGSNVESIGNCAFAHCTKLKCVTIPEKVKNIGSSAFSGCKNLETVNYYAINCTYMGSRKYPVFNDCSKITTINMGDNVENIPGAAFYGCINLKNINMPDNVKNIGEWAFSECKSITNITIPEGVTSIGNYAFHKCESIKNITIPDNVENIGDGAFYNCTNLSTVNYNAINCTEMGSISYPAFYCCPKITSVNIGDNVKIIPRYAFSDCASIKKLSIGNSVTNIELCAFNNCTNLKNIIIPDSVTNIGVSAFEYCTKLKTATIGKNVTSIGYDAFYGCDILTIYGYEDSYVESYAYDNDIPFNVLKYNRTWNDQSVDKTGIYSLFYHVNPNSVVEPDDKTVDIFDKNGNMVKYNEVKGGYPLVKGENYTIKSCMGDYVAKIDFVMLDSKVFPDTSSSGWYNDAVTYAVGAGIMSGYSNGNFGTSDSIQRQDFLVMLSRLDGVNLDDYKYESYFPDVSQNSYYEAAVNWGAENGIVTGYQNGKFGVGDKVTREQLVTFLYRYARYKGYDNSYRNDREESVSAQYTDYKDVTYFAKASILWAIEKGVISGKTPTTIAPQGNAQRCEVAKIMYNIFLNDIFY